MNVIVMTDNNININELFDAAMQDPSLLSTIDTNKLLESIEDEGNDYLQNKTISIINQEIFGTIQSIDAEIERKRDICDKLIGFRLVEEINELHKGKYVRWIKDNKLSSGGIVVNIKFLDTGINVLCKSPSNRFVQYKFDECITFQKLTETEQLIIMAYEYAS